MASLRQFMIWKHWDELGPDDDAYFDWVQDGFDEDGPEYEPPPYLFGCEVLPDPWEAVWEADWSARGDR